MSTQLIKSFKEEVELKYQLYNSLFLTLPLDAVKKTGKLLPLFNEDCNNGLKQGLSPKLIVDTFFANHKAEYTEKEQVDFLFKMIQYIERQVVLIDALEDAAYGKIHQIGDSDSWSRIANKANAENKEAPLKEILSNFGIRVVLTAHPTQFYTGQVLGIISDLTDAIAKSDSALVQDLLNQLGRTPFIQKMKPSPFDEAQRLIWYLSHIFYPAIGQLIDRIGESFPEEIDLNSNIVSLGFWPGGDRDGNPFVTTHITKKVSNKLRFAIANCYFFEIRQLKRRLSFTGIYSRLDNLQNLLLEEISNVDEDRKVDLSFLISELTEIEHLLIKHHQGLFLDKLKTFKRKVCLFGFHFASIDIRQDSRIINEAFNSVMERYPDLIPADLYQRPLSEQIDILLSVNGKIDPTEFTNPIVYDTLASFETIRSIQKQNGEKGAHRYIISNCRGPIDMARIFALARLCAWQNSPLSLDIIPLFETIDDLKDAGESMKTMYKNTLYKKHLTKRKSRQTVMLGFSDGTKDGGYLMANWSIYQAKETITGISRQNGIEVIFFDGRGGPPARGGGNTQKFYSSLGDNIESKEIQLTVQGQTISSHYGTQQAAIHNLGHLITAGIDNKISDRPDKELKLEQRNLIEKLASESYKSYNSLKEHPLFLAYLEERSTVKYYGMANIGSRPSKRGSSNKLKFEDLRAIPFVGAWSQLKQNVPGYFGLGTALKAQEKAGNLEACINLYKESRLFRALIDNSMQSMSKTNFPLTSYMEKDAQFGKFWQLIHNEFELSKTMVLKVSQQKILLEDNHRSRMSIKLREQVVLPLLTIQQYALIKIQEKDSNTTNDLTDKYEKMVIRSLFGNINASRNSV